MAGFIRHFARKNIADNSKTETAIAAGSYGCLFSQKTASYGPRPLAGPFVIHVKDSGSHLSAEKSSCADCQQINGDSRPDTE